MSWDISIMDLPSGAASVSDIPSDFMPQPLGRRDELITRICGFAARADFSDPSWGQLETPDFAIEFNMGREQISDSIMLHVHGGGFAADFVGGLLDHLGLRAIDCSEGEFFNHSTAEASFARWQEYRDRSIGS